MQGINFECFRCARFGGRSQISAVLGRPILPMSTDFLKVLFFSFSLRPSDDIFIERFGNRCDQRQLPIFLFLFKLNEF